jgi:hypothetical protein
MADTIAAAPAVEAAPPVEAIPVEPYEITDDDVPF